MISGFEMCGIGSMVRPLSMNKHGDTNALVGAQAAAANGGMISGPLDLSWMGVYTIWINSLGSLRYMCK